MNYEVPIGTLNLLHDGEHGIMPVIKSDTGWIDCEGQAENPAKIPQLEQVLRSERPSEPTFTWKDYLLRPRKTNERIRTYWRSEQQWADGHRYVYGGLVGLYINMPDLRGRKSPAGENMNERGFTAIEILVVLLIMGILTAIAIPTFKGQQRIAENRVACQEGKQKACDWLDEEGHSRLPVKSPTPSDTICVYKNGEKIGCVQED